MWKHWEAKGVEIRLARHRDWRLPLDAFLEKMDARTRVVSTAYVTYGNGCRVNLPELGRACRERGVRLVVDGVQGAGILATPLNELGADIVAIGGHKGLFGLTGSGVVYCREELVNQLAADFVKSRRRNRRRRATSTASSITCGPRTVSRAAIRISWESGCCGTAPNSSSRSGCKHIEQRVRELTTACLKLLKAAGLKTQTPQAWEERAQIVNVLVPNAAQLMDRLKEKHRVIANVKDDALRLSMGFFNNEEDLERAVHAIKRELAGKPASVEKQAL